MKREVSCFAIADFDFEDLNSNHLKTVLQSFFQLKIKKMIKVSASFNEIIKTSKDLKYMIFLKAVNINDIRKLQIAAAECENILSVLNEHIQTLNAKREFR